MTGLDNEDITRYIMCCLDVNESGFYSEESDALSDSSASSNTAATDSNESIEFTDKEQFIVDNLHPIWYGRDDGYQGTTHDDAKQFCKSIGGMELCPLEAYCPNGAYVEGEPPLFLRMDAFEGEQWAPVSASDENDDTYVLVGTLYNNPTTTCNTYQHFNNGQIPQWGIDGSIEQLKQHILCCKDPTYISIGIDTDTSDVSIPVSSPTTTDGGAHFDLTEAIETELMPLWLSWTGGSHADAEAFCQGFDGRNLCPYAAYCPHGPGQPVLGGHSSDFNSEGEQWAPVFGHSNKWVMIGQKQGNSATTCFGHEDLEGGPPDWGLTSDNPEVKKHIMCCMLQKTR